VEIPPWGGIPPRLGTNELDEQVIAVTVFTANRQAAQTHDFHPNTQLL